MRVTLLNTNVHLNEHIKIRTCYNAKIIAGLTTNRGNAFYQKFANAFS